MMTTHQLKAARALLDWTQQDLAKAAGMHLNVINNLERGLTNPRQQTVEKLKKTLEAQGIIFIGARGVELARQAISSRKIEGETFLKALIDDILVNTKGKNDEIFTILADIRNFDAHDAPATKRFYDEKAKRGFKERLITRTMPGFYPRNAAQYRLIDAAALGGTDTVIYGDHVAFIVWTAQEVMVLKGEAVAESQRRLFETLWAMGQEPARPVRIAND